MVPFAWLLLAALAATASGSPFQPCDNTAVKGTISKLEIKGCPDGAVACILKKGVDASITLTFTPNVDADKIQVKAYGIIGGVPLPYPIPKSDACQESGLKCPLKKSVAVTYTQGFPVQKFFPSISLDVKWTFVDSANNELICALIPVKIE